ncbi:hypothetical protein AB0K14_38775 [Actinosynnema sp. NPDC050801]|uniref:hypothetical protein n=1 Tax=unclassified Actinosynnema TaxID=2637065 RepID=UPI0033DDFB34
MNPAGTARPTIVVVDTEGSGDVRQVVADAFRFDGCSGFYFSQPKAQEALATTDPERLPELAEGRAPMPIRITAQAKGGEDVLLTGMRLVESTVSPPPTTGLVLDPICGGTPVTPRNFQVDLDRPDPTVKPIPMIGDTDDETGYPAVPFPFKWWSPRPSASS